MCSRRWAFPRELGVAALRFSFGKDSTMEDVDA